MDHYGFSHVGLATADIDATRNFYETVLGFAPARCDILEVKEGGEIFHVFYDTGRGQLLAFMGPRGVEGIPDDFDAGINRGLGLPRGMIHFAFEAESTDKLAAKREALIARGVAVSEIVDHDGWCKSIYFEDPNGIQLEYCCLTRALTPDDAVPKVRAQISNARRPRATP
jgi:catechol 2,3-dioxygenase-like lactoylglutathione lyase family enzyme